MKTLSTKMQRTLTIAGAVIGSGLLIGGTQMLLRDAKTPPAGVPDTVVPFAQPPAEKRLENGEPATDVESARELAYATNETGARATSRCSSGDLGVTFVVPAGWSSTAACTGFALQDSPTDSPPLTAQVSELTYDRFTKELTISGDAGISIQSSTETIGGHRATRVTATITQGNAPALLEVSWAIEIDAGVLYLTALAATGTTADEQITAIDSLARTVTFQ